MLGCAALAWSTALAAAAQALGSWVQAVQRGPSGCSCSSEAGAAPMAPWQALAGQRPRLAPVKSKEKAQRCSLRTNSACFSCGGTSRSSGSGSAAGAGEQVGRCRERWGRRAVLPARSCTLLVQVPLLPAAPCPFAAHVLLPARLRAPAYCRRISSGVSGGSEVRWSAGAAPPAGAGPLAPGTASAPPGTAPPGALAPCCPPAEGFGGVPALLPLAELSLAFIWRSLRCVGEDGRGGARCRGPAGPGAHQPARWAGLGASCPRSHGAAPCPDLVRMPAARQAIARGASDGGEGWGQRRGLQARSMVAGRVPRQRWRDGRKQRSPWPPHAP